METTPELTARIAELVQNGFRFALHDVFAYSEKVRALLPLIEIIKLDLKGIPLDRLTELVPKLKRGNKKLLAEKVETMEQFKFCSDLGFDYFQGYYFAKTDHFDRQELRLADGHHQAGCRCLGRMPITMPSRRIKTDASVGLNLLLLANTVAVGGARKRIDSLKQALIFIGRAQLQRWLQIMLYVEPAKKGKGVGPLLVLATTRGKFLELIAQKIQPDQLGAADTAFTVGIMSLMDTLFSMKMTDILEQIAVTDDISGALLTRAGRYGQMLAAVEYIECTEDILSPQASSQLLRQFCGGALDSSR